jgi:hypothetical protein
MSNKPQSQPGWSNVSIERTPQKRAFTEANRHNPIADESPNFRSVWKLGCSHRAR